MRISFPHSHSHCHGTSAILIGSWPAASTGISPSPERWDEMHGSCWRSLSPLSELKSFVAMRVPTSERLLMQWVTANSCWKRERARGKNVKVGARREAPCRSDNAISGSLRMRPNQRKSVSWITVLYGVKQCARFLYDFQSKGKDSQLFCKQNCWQNKRSGNYGPTHAR